MKKDNSERLSELDCKVQDVTSLIFALCEERIRVTRGKPSPQLLALVASSLAVKEAIRVFLAIAHLSE
ncbi:hypothetical protein [Desulfovibrio cuneatus]|uniref:hypothetical protein n=1 Tax=Desulfovibrio cuneatus TaxID=159728 RepID=UPI00047F906C|nr:hypothetical protein [Desulfovibrio cuneatus]